MTDFEMILTGEHAQLDEALHLTTEERRQLVKTLLDCGQRAIKGFELAVNAVEIMRGHEEPRIDKRSQEPAPFIFDPNDPLGIFQGFRKGLEMLTDRLGIDYLPGVLENTPYTETACAYDPESDSWLVSMRTEPTEIQMLDAGIAPDVNEVIAVYIEPETDSFLDFPTL